MNYVICALCLLLIAGSFATLARSLIKMLRGERCECCGQCKKYCRQKHLDRL